MTREYCNNIDYVTSGFMYGINDYDEKYTKLLGLYQQIDYNHVKHDEVLSFIPPIVRRLFEFCYQNDLSNDVIPLTNINVIEICQEFDRTFIILHDILSRYLPNTNVELKLIELYVGDYINKIKLEYNKQKGWLKRNF